MGYINLITCDARDYHKLDIFRYYNRKFISVYPTPGDSNNLTIAVQLELVKSIKNQVHTDYYFEDDFTKAKTQIPSLNCLTCRK